MPVTFVAYIDESGDTGLELVKPHDVRGATEWLILAAFVVKIADDSKMVSWTQDVQSDFISKRGDLHFNRLLPFKKSLVCNALAKKNAKCFVVMSNKKNIERYKNPRLDDGNRSWIYWWLARLLLERVTEYCEEQTPADQRGKDTLRIIFSRRGGLTCKDFNDYLTKLYWQSRLSSLVLSYKDIKWSVIDWEEIRVLDHKDRAGLQLADVVAGAFFEAVELNRGGIANCDPSYAKALKPIIAVRSTGAVVGFGIKPMPLVNAMGLSPDQMEIFKFYGY
jgi:hypothetical protein